MNIRPSPSGIASATALCVSFFGIGLQLDLIVQEPKSVGTASTAAPVSLPTAAPLALPDSDGSDVVQEFEVLREAVRELREQVLERVPPGPKDRLAGRDDTAAARQLAALDNRLRVIEVWLAGSGLTEPDDDPAGAAGDALVLDAEEEALAQLDDLEWQLSSEARSDSWAEATEATIADSFHEPDLADSVLVSADCRTTRCKVVVDHFDQDALARFDEHFLASVHAHVGTATSSVEPIDSGEFRSFVYLNR